MALSANPTGICMSATEKQLEEILASIQGAVVVVDEDTFTLAVNLPCLCYPNLFITRTFAGCCTQLTLPRSELQYRRCGLNGMKAVRVNHLLGGCWQSTWPLLRWKIGFLSGN